MHGTKIHIKEIWMDDQADLTIKTTDGHSIFILNDGGVLTANNEAPVMMEGEGSQDTAFFDLTGRITVEEDGKVERLTDLQKTVVDIGRLTKQDRKRIFNYFCIHCMMYFPQGNPKDCRCID